MDSRRLSPVRSYFCAIKSPKPAAVKAGFGVPILANHQVLAVLVFFEAREEERQMVEPVAAVATHLGAMLQRSSGFAPIAPLNGRRCDWRLRPCPSAGRHFRQSTAVALDRVVEIVLSSNLSWLLYQN